MGGVHGRRDRLAEAAGLTTSRIHARLQKQRTLPPDLHLLADDEVKEVLEHAFDVAIVAAGRVGYPEYRRYGAYICQAGTAFRNDPRHFAFYANSEVKPEIAAVLGRRAQLLFTPETAQQLREQGEAGLADVVEQAVHDGARPVGRSSSTCSQPRTTSARSRSDNRSLTPPPARAAASFAASATPPVRPRPSRLSNKARHPPVTEHVGRRARARVPHRPVRRQPTSTAHAGADIAFTPAGATQIDGPAQLANQLANQPETRCPGRRKRLP